MGMCIVCRAVFPGTGLRCPAHTTPRPSAAERRRRKRAVDDWIAANGMVCPGWRCPPHAVEKLEADHVQARIDGGEHGPLQALCHACNARKNIERRFGPPKPPNPWSKGRGGGR